MVRSSANQRLGGEMIPQSMETLALGGVCLLIVAGALLRARARQTLVVGYVVIALLIIYSTPWPSQFNRYVSPLSPFLAVFFLTGLSACTRWIAGSRVPAARGIAVGAATTVIGGVLLMQLATLVLLFTKSHLAATWPRAGEAPLHYRLFFYTGLSTTTDAALDWLRSYAAPDTVVAATIPPYAYLRSGRLSVFPPLVTDGHQAQQLLDGVPVSYLVVDEGDFNRYTARVVASVPHQWRRVYQTPVREEPGESIAIYERVRTAAGGDNVDR